MPRNKLDFDLPAYLVYLILDSKHKLKQLAPDHILVKAIEGAFKTDREDITEQLELDIKPSLMRHQAD